MILSNLIIFSKCRTQHTLSAASAISAASAASAPTAPLCSGLRGLLTAGAAALSLSFLSCTTVLAGPSTDPGLILGGGGPGSSGREIAVFDPALQYYSQPLANPVVHPSALYTYEQMEQDMTALGQRYPGTVQVDVIGRSLDGRNIYDLVVGNPGGSRQILFQGALHAREYITVPLLMQQAEFLLAGYDNGYYNGLPLRELLRDTAIHFIPMANPDGVALSQMGESAIRTPSLLQMIQACYAVDTAERRTSSSYAHYLRRWKSNANGVDLNHNFDAGWDSVVSRVTHNSGLGFKGHAPVSEPESRALVELANRIHFLAVINYHAMGNIIYWDTQGNRQGDASLALAYRVAAANGYALNNRLTTGGYKDWLQQKDNPSPSITIEVGSSSAPVSFSEYPNIWAQNKMVPGIALTFGR